MRIRTNRKGTRGARDTEPVDNVGGSVVRTDMEQPELRSFIETVAQSAAERAVQALSDRARDAELTESAHEARTGALLAVFDGIEEAVRTVDSLSNVSKRRAKRFAPLSRLLRRLQSRYLAVLADFRIQPMEPSTQVNYATDDVLDVFASSVPAADESIAEVLRRGFMRDGTVVRPRQVIAFRYVPGHEPVRRKNNGSTQ